MLKIKDNVDLKELEKFGFREVILHPNSLDIKKEVKGYSSRIYWVLEKDKIIRIALNNQTLKSLASNNEVEDTLYDLIQAGLVEKVVKNNESN